MTAAAASGKKDKIEQGTGLDKGSGIHLENVSKWYGQVMGLIDVTAFIGSGVTGILGPNGAGKSTFIKLVTGQIKPSKGKITAFGMPVWNNPEYNKMVGYCPEYEDMYDWMTGIEFVEFMVRLNGFGKKEAKALSWTAIETVGMTEEAGRKIATYSKGMRQRIKLAQAIAHKPKILFLDEPLAGTDPVGRFEIINLIRRLGSREYGISVIISSHILHEIERMTKQLLMLHKGRLLAWGEMDEIRDKLDQYPHTLLIRTAKKRKLARHLINLPQVSSVQVDDVKGTLNVKVLEPDIFYSELPGILTRENISIEQLGSLDEDLESIFSYLTRRNEV